MNGIAIVFGLRLVRRRGEDPAVGKPLGPDVDVEPVVGGEAREEELAVGVGGADLDRRWKGVPLVERVERLARSRYPPGPGIRSRGSRAGRRESASPDHPRSSPRGGRRAKTAGRGRIDRLGLPIRRSGPGEESLPWTPGEPEPHGLPEDLEDSLVATIRGLRSLDGQGPHGTRSGLLIRGRLGDPLGPGRRDAR